MTRKRKKQVGLTGTRIYIRRGKYQYFSPSPIWNPKSKKETKWIPLCEISEGELAARIALSNILKSITTNHSGNFPVHFMKWKNKVISERTKNTPVEAARKFDWDRSTRDLMIVLTRIQDAFQDFDVLEVTPHDVAQFLDQWEGQRAAQLYKGHLVKFFQWATRSGLSQTNPAREVSVITPKKRKVYVTHEQYLTIRDAMLIGENGQLLKSGQMMQIYLDLLYLLYQRGTDVRLLKWQQVSKQGIYFKPSKTERTSGKEIIVPMTPLIREVLERARTLRKKPSDYVITNEKGLPYTAHGLGTFFERARRKVGLNHITLKDIRAKAATDATKAGHSLDELKVALAHTDTKTTLRYVRANEVPVSSVSLVLPDRDKARQN